MSYQARYLSFLCVKERASLTDDLIGSDRKLQTDKDYIPEEG